MSKNFIYIDSGGYQSEGGSTFEESDFVNASAGVADAGKPIKLDAAGLLDTDMINISEVDHNSLLNTHNLTTDIDHNDLTNTHNLTTDISHDSITGVSASTAHAAFSLLTGTRDFTGIVAYDSHKTFTVDEQIPDKKYVDDAIAAGGTAAEWQDSCLDIVLDSTTVTPSTGSRYLINGTGTNAFAGEDYNIAEWNGASYDFTTPTTGTYTSVDDESDGLYYFGGTGPWVKKYYESTTASLGCEKVGVDIRLDLLSGGGLKITSSEVGVEPNDFAGAGLVDDGADNLAIDWSTAFNDAKAVKANDLNSITNGEGASIIGIEDAGGYTTNANVESVTQELLAKLQRFGFSYTVGTGGVTKADLLYISANNTVLPMSDITAGVWGIGLAHTTEIAAATVIPSINNDVLTGVLTTATAGTKYYWNGTTLTTTIPTTSGGYVWQVGIAKNATDLNAQVAFVFKRA